MRGRPQTPPEGWRRPTGPAKVRASIGHASVSETPDSRHTKSPPGQFKMPRRWGMPAGESPWARARARYSTPVCTHSYRSMTVPKLSPAGSRWQAPGHADRPPSADLPVAGPGGGGVELRRSGRARWPARGHGGHVGGPR